MCLKDHVDSQCQLKHKTNIPKHKSRFKNLNVVKCYANPYLRSTARILVVFIICKFAVGGAGISTVDDDDPNNFLCPGPSGADCTSCCDYTCKYGQSFRLAYYSTSKLDANNNLIPNSSASFYLPAVYLAAQTINSPKTIYPNNCGDIILPRHYLHISEVYTGYEIYQDIGRTFSTFNDLLSILFNIAQANLLISEPAFFLAWKTRTDVGELKALRDTAINQEFIMLLGPNTNEEALLLPAFATGFQLVQVAHAVDSPEQSQVSLFPSFFRLSLPNTVYVDPTVNLIKQLEYNNIAVLVEGTSDGYPKIVSDHMEDVPLYTKLYTIIYSYIYM